MILHEFYCSQQKYKNLGSHNHWTIHEFIFLTSKKQPNNVFSVILLYEMKTALVVQCSVRNNVEVLKQHISEGNQAF